jgi:coenzyme Q-binding protein COQ10
MPRINFERIIKADRDRVFSVVTNYSDFQKTLPKYFPSIRVRSRRDNVAVVEEHMRIAGRELTMMTKHITKSPESHEMFVIGGDAKGSHIMERYESVQDGTKVTVMADIKLGRAIRIAGLFSRRKLNRDLEDMIDGFARIIES